MLEVDPQKLGELLLKLDVTRVILGHKRISSTIRYTHGQEHKAEWQFIKDIFSLEKTGKYAPLDCKAKEDK